MASAVLGTSDDDEYETVVYTGPGLPLASAPGETSPKECIWQQRVGKPPPPHPSMHVKLAQTATEYGGLLSPGFFLSSSDASRGTPSSSESVPPLSSGKNHETPFSFSKVDSAKMAARQSTNEERLERLQILEENPSPEENESDWEEWPQNFIKGKGFVLGIQPGCFYKHKTDPCFYVKLPHRSGYEVILTNENPTPCHLDLYVNGKYTNAEVIPAESTRTIDGPQYSDHAFKLFRANEAPSGMNVNVDDRVNGHIKAVFTPGIVGINSRERSTSELPPSDLSLEDDIFELLNNADEFLKESAAIVSSAEAEDAFRTLNLSRVTRGVTLLQGDKKSRKFIAAPPMATDPSKAVTLQLRLIASLDEEVTATDEEIFSLEPPLPPS